MKKLQQTFVAGFKPLPEWLIAKLPEPRRRLHRKAVDVVMRHATDGVPFALMLRSYAFTQLFAESESTAPHPLENLVVDGLKGTGIGFVQIQIDDQGVGNDLYRSALSTDLRVHAPALFIASEGWLEQVSYLIDRAECIIVLLSLATPGVVQELETIVAAGRADRTVVLVTAEEAGGAVDGTIVIFETGHEPDTTVVLATPILSSFPRVLWVGDINRTTPLQTFVFGDLIERIKSIRALKGPARREFGNNAKLDHNFPVTWRGVRQAFEKLAIASRAARRIQFAAQYFGCVAMLSMMEDDVLGAIDATVAQVSVLLAQGLHRKAQTIVAELIKAIEPIARERWSSDSAFVVAHAHLVSERARALIRAGELVEAQGILKEEWARCQTPLNRRALSTVCTMTAWVLRATSDVDGVLSAANRAFELAQAETAPWEMARALTVLGATLDDLGEFSSAEGALRKAAEIIPPDRYEDAFLVRMRLAIVFEHSARLADARSVLEEAVRVAGEGSLGTWAGEAELRLSKLTRPDEAAGA